MTGFSPAVRALILQRDGGCFMQGDHYGGLQVHHRAPRQIGGAKAAWVNRASNGITLCMKHHTWVESHRSEAENLGLLVRRGVHLPPEIPVQHEHGVVFLTDEGTWSLDPPERN